MKRFAKLCALMMALAVMMPAASMAAEIPEVCYPTSITTSEDGTQIRKVYDLTPESDPAGISRSDFEQDGFHYTLTDLLKQELPENESRQHTETVVLDSAKKDVESVLALLPQEKEFITEDGLMGMLTLQLDTVQVEVAGYGSSTKAIAATRTYPNLVNQDTQHIPKTIEDGGKTLTLQSIDWQTDNTANVDGYALGERYTAVATYTGTTTNSYVKGYTVSKTACEGILRRASERGKELPEKLKRALEIQAGIVQPDGQPTELEAYHINQRDEGIDLHGVSGALMATSNMQMQTFVTQADEKSVLAFAANQRDEVRNLYDVAGAVQAQPGMKQQTFIASFSAGAGASAGGIGYSEKITPTLKGTASGNCMPSVMRLND